MVSKPFNADPGVAYPILYVLDGNVWFATATQTLALSVRDLKPAIVVGIGYPTDDLPAPV